MLNFLQVDVKPDVRAKYYNYTPYMGGNYEGKTFVYSNGKYVFVGFPSPQSLIGKVRWLARVAVASFIPNPRSYGDVERAFRVNLGNFELGLIEYAFGTLRDNSWASPFSVHLTYEVTNPRPWDVAKKCYERKSRNKRFKCEERNRYNDLLVLGDVRNREPSNLPLTARGLTIEIEIFKTPRARAQCVDKIFDAFVTTVLLTPLLLGLGKATNRGFGRFEYQEVDHGVSKKILEILDKIAGKGVEDDAETIKESVKEGIREFLELWAEAIKCLGYDANIKKAWIDGFVPSLASVLHPVHGVYVSRRTYDANKALDIIERSVLKIEWKRAKGINTQGSGANFHTWPLGLPRNMRNTGYLPLSPNNAPGSRCLNQSTLESLWKSAVLYDIKANTLRRQSMFIMFPLPPKNNESRIVVLPLPAYDTNLEVDDKSPKRYDVKLFHVGKHRGSNEYHVVPVSDIISTRNIADHCGRDFGGVENPQRSPLINASFVEILQVAYDWVKSILR